VGSLPTIFLEVPGISIDNRKGGAPLPPTPTPTPVNQPPTTPAQHPSIQGPLARQTAAARAPAHAHLQRVFAVLGLAPQVGREEAVGLGQREERGLHEVAQRLARAGGGGVAVLDAGHLQHLRVRKGWEGEGEQGQEVRRGFAGGPSTPPASSGMRATISVCACPALLCAHPVLPCPAPPCCLPARPHALPVPTPLPPLCQPCHTPSHPPSWAHAPPRRQHPGAQAPGGWTRSRTCR